MAWEPDYISPLELKNYIRTTNPNDTIDDTEITSAATGASRAVDKHCSTRPNGMGAFRQFGQVAVPEARYYTARWDMDIIRWVVEIDDLMDTTGLIISADLGNDDVYEATISNYVLRPRDALLKNRPYTQIAISTMSSNQPTFFRDGVKVVGRWGWTAFPGAVVLGTKIQGHRFYKRRVTPFGVTGAPAKGTNIQLLDTVDPDVGVILDPYVKLGWTE